MGNHSNHLWRTRGGAGSATPQLPQVRDFTCGSPDFPVAVPISEEKKMNVFPEVSEVLVLKAAGHRLWMRAYWALAPEDQSLCLAWGEFHYIADQREHIADQRERAVSA